ncbi:MAG: UDP-3-O-(3-hydroxymyristoyl)glucosamine N-acyltransferase [Bacteroidaceae bacterium]|jgi:UDP-3-O-[3-hydroxymyristoyl] glucosamine N-acyltransferase|nr:UDP-3-O-(3-hydroxymyristoyl)glucosamine N-acyltransferase [Bacteroidaceae bacterium]
MEFTAKQIAELLGGTVDGNGNAAVNTFAKIEEGTPGALSFLSNVKYTQHIYTTKSSVVLVNKDFKPEQPISATLIRVDNAYEALAKLMSIYASMKPGRTGISSLASVSEKAKIGKNVYIGPFAVIEDGATVGDNTQIYPLVTIGEGASVGSDCILYPHVTIYYACKVGNRCILHAGSVVGADGFGFAPTPNGYDKIPQIGIAELEDDVEIGANTCVDRSTMGRTVVHKGVKLDNMVQVAHNVEVGENTVISAQTGIAGSSKVGAWCMIGGQSGISGHLTIGDKVNFCAKTGAISNIESNQTIMGYPAIAHRNYLRSSILFKQLPEMDATIRQLQKEIEELKAKLESR